LSDHRYILFQVSVLEISRVTYCNPPTTNWEFYWEDLKANIGVVPRVLYLVQNVELAVDLMQQVILFSCQQNCPPQLFTPPRKVPWWSKGLSRIKVSKRRLYNEAKMTETLNPIKCPSPIVTRK
jgi:hypothetical protein